MRLWRIEFLWLALVVAVLVMAVWWFPGMGILKSDSYSVSNSGKKALFQSLQRLDGDVFRSTDFLVPRPGFEDRLLILGPSRLLTTEEWNELYYEVLDGASLVFAAGSNERTADADVFGVKIVPLESESAEDLFADKGSDGESGEEAKSEGDSDNGSASETGEQKDAQRDANASQNEDDEPVPWEDADDDNDDEKPFWYLDEFTAETDLIDGDVVWRTESRIDFDGLDWDVLVAADEDPQVVRRELGAGTVVFVASDEIFSNHALTEPDRALLAYRIIEAAPCWGETWLDESINSSGVPKVVGILFDPAFRPLTLQLILLTVLFGWSGSHRFGPAAPPAAAPRRSIAEHAEALGILYYRAGAGAHAVRAQLEFFKEELRRRFGTSIRLENAQSLSLQTGIDAEDVRTLLTETNIAPETKLANQAAGRLLRRLNDLYTRLRNEPTDRPS